MIAKSFYIRKRSKEPPENNLHDLRPRLLASCATALTAPVIVWSYPPYCARRETSCAIRRHGRSVTIRPTAIYSPTRPLRGITPHDDVTGDEGARNAGRMSQRRRM